MNGVLAQIVSLTAYGNDFLKNEKSLAAFYPGNSTFQFCNQVDFRTFTEIANSSEIQERIVAGDPIKWLTQLRNEGCWELRLFFEPSKDQTSVSDYKLAGFVGGGGNWLIEAAYDRHSDYWANSWEVTNPNAIDQKIWKVRYGVVSKNAPISNLQIDQEEIKNELDRILIDIADFAYKQNLENWGIWFTKAKLILESNNPLENYYHQDLIPVGNYSLIAKQILFSSGTAWAFGGMGSWNDLAFDDEKCRTLYEMLSGRLYSCINNAIISAINSY